MSIVNCKYLAFCVSVALITVGGQGLFTANAHVSKGLTRHRAGNPNVLKRGGGKEIDEIKTRDETTQSSEWSGWRKKEKTEAELEVHTQALNLNSKVEERTPLVDRQVSSDQSKERDDTGSVGNLSGLFRALSAKDKEAFTRSAGFRSYGTGENPPPGGGGLRGRWSRLKTMEKLTLIGIALVVPTLVLAAVGVGIPFLIRELDKDRSGDPEVTDVSVSGITSSTAILSGAINTHGSKGVTYYFHYFAPDNPSILPVNTPSLHLQSENGSIETEPEPIQNLQPNVKYEVELIATAVDGDKGTDDTTFTSNKPRGALSQEGCISDANIQDCEAGRALFHAQAVEISADNRNVYVGGATGIAVFDRDSAGNLTQKSGTAGCISGSLSGCTTGRAISNVQQLKISSNGNFLYALSAQSNSIAILARNPITGELTEPTGDTGCISQNGLDDKGQATCQRGGAMANPQNMDSALSYGGNDYLYLSSFGDTTPNNNGVAVFQENATTGLTYTSCITVSGGDGNDGTCTQSSSVNNARSVAVTHNSPAEKQALYVASSQDYNEPGTITAFSVDSSGTPSFLSCENSTGTGCTQAIGIEGVSALETSPGLQNLNYGSRNLYSVSGSSDEGYWFVASFQIYGNSAHAGRGPWQLPSPYDCLSSSDQDSCVLGEAMNQPAQIVSTHDAENAYFVASDSDSIVVLNRHTNITPLVSPYPVGALTQLDQPFGCMALTPIKNDCEKAVGLDSPRAIAVSSDDKTAYVASYGSGSVTTFSASEG